MYIKDTRNQPYEVRLAEQINDAKRKRKLKKMSIFQPLINVFKSAKNGNDEAIAMVRKISDNLKNADSEAQQLVILAAQESNFIV